jgi:ankyrin repeat protein
MAELPDSPSLDWLRKQAKSHLGELRQTNPEAKLSDAQFALAREYGFSSWRALKSHVDSLTVDGRLFEAARNGDLDSLTTLLDTNPNGLHARMNGFTLLHAAARQGERAAVELLLGRGLDANVRDEGDNAYPMHWAAAEGHLEVVRLLAEAGGDVVGEGDDHQLEVIGWATCWATNATQRAIADLLVSRGARHHIFSAIALDLADEVRRIAARDRTALSKPMSHNENFQLPLHFAVRKNRPAIVDLLLELGADPGAKDGEGVSASVYAADPGVDRAVIETLARHGGIDLFGALSLGDEATAGELLGADPELAAHSGALHLLAKRGDVEAVRWLLARGADPNARWSHWDAEVTPLHLAAAQGNVDVVRLLLAAGADPSIRDSKHDGDAKGWAEYGRVPRSPHAEEIVRILERAPDELT